MTKKFLFTIFLIAVSHASVAFSQDAEDAPINFSNTAEDGSQINGTIDPRNGRATGEIYRTNEDGEVSTTGTRVDIDTKNETITTAGCSNLRTSDGQCVTTLPETFNYGSENND